MVSDDEVIALLHDSMIRDHVCKCDHAYYGKEVHERGQPGSMRSMRAMRSMIYSKFPQSGALAKGTLRPVCSEKLPL